MHWLIFSKGLCRYLGASLLAVWFLSGCSSDFSRFSEGISAGSNVSKFEPPQQVPPYNEERNYSGNQASYESFDSGDLPPIDPPLPVKKEPKRQKSEKSEERLFVDSSEREKSIQTGNTNLEVETNQRLDIQWSTYIVKRGDTLYWLARNNNTTVAKLKSQNDLTGDLILIGQKIMIPEQIKPVPLKDEPNSKPAQSTFATAESHPEVATPETAGTEAKNSSQEMKGETLSHSAVPSEEKTSAEKMVGMTEESDQKKTPDSSKTDATNNQKNGSDSPSVQETLVTDETISRMRWPVKGRILSHFGQREGVSTNDGIDIIVPEGTEVHAVESGTVIYASDGLKEFGNTILIRHANNIVSVYGHNREILVLRSQKIRRGDVIAKSGMSGSATTPRLHFEIRKNSTPVNPLDYLEK